MAGLPQKGEEGGVARLQADVDPAEAQAEKPRPPGGLLLKPREEVQKAQDRLPGEARPHGLQKGNEGLGEGQGVAVRREDPAP